jgi:cytochrome oxidase Cu insertion factor (SCO1/SenC/PrrC family)
MIRTPLALVPYLFAVAFVIAGLLWHAGDFVSGSQSFGEGNVGGSFVLTDQNGQVRKDTDFRGRYMLVYFGYSSCPDICPTTLAVMADALDKLPRKGRVVPVFITIDPARDTPGILKTYLKSFGSAFVGLTGSNEAVTAIAKKYHVYAAKRPLKGGGYAMDHTSQLYLMGPDGKFVAVFDETLGPDGLAAELKKRM